MLPREKTFSVTRTISGSPDKVFSMINELKNWEKWSPWKKLDPHMNLTYSEPSQGKDAWYSWKGNKSVGYGKLSITNTEPNKEIGFVLQYEDQIPATGSFTLNATDKGTDVTWTIEIHGAKNALAAKLFDGYRYVMMRFFLSKNFSQGLDNLNTVCH